MKQLETKRYILRKPTENDAEIIYEKWGTDKENIAQYKEHKFYRNIIEAKALIKGKWLVFFSHPGDFTPVCTTEMIAFSRAYTYFQQINTELLGLSIDSNPSHLAWMYDIYCKTGIQLPFPIVADRNGQIARKYGMISNDISTTETVRNVFIIDDKGIVRTIFVYPLNVGRFIPEIIRTVQALQMADCSKGSTAANWMPGQPVIVPAPKTFNELLERQNYINENQNGISWYLSFKEPPAICENSSDDDTKNC